MFGALAHEVEDVRYDVTYGRSTGCKELDAVVIAIRSGQFGDASLFESLLQTLQQDYYIIAHDFAPCKIFVQWE